jgi:predicted Rossmann fold flavoprotein
MRPPGERKAPVHYDVIVVGGGAAGMMAAGRAAELGKRVLVVEKNTKLGEKLRISGGGRCNITNAEYDTRALLAHYTDAQEYLRSSFARFGVKDTFAFFEKLGLPLVVQARKRAFPKTERATDVCKALEKYIREGSVEIVSHSPVTRVNVEGGRVVSIACGRTEYKGKAFVLATGGMSHPETGSTGDGFRFLKHLGHTVVDPTPTIVPLKVSDQWVRDVSGVSLSFMKITFFLEGKKAFSETGKILFTHFGLSGPLILNVAGRVADLLHEGAVTATIDAFPDTDLGAMGKKILSVFDKNKNKALRNVIGDIAPHGMGPTVLALLAGQVNFEGKVHSVSKDERKAMAHLLKALPVTVTGLMGFDRAVVADGGVPLKEIDTRTMQSLKIPNLFVVGDLLHINRPSGGYSLQLCWTSGYVAGSNA